MEGKPVHLCFSKRSHFIFFLKNSRRNVEISAVTPDLNKVHPLNDTKNKINFVILRFVALRLHYNTINERAFFEILILDVSLSSFRPQGKPFWKTANDTRHQLIFSIGIVTSHQMMISSWRLVATHTLLVFGRSAGIPSKPGASSFPSILSEPMSGLRALVLKSEPTFQVLNRHSPSIVYFPLLRGGESRFW